MRQAGPDWLRALVSGGKENVGPSPNRYWRQCPSAVSYVCRRGQPNGSIASRGRLARRRCAPGRRAGARDAAAARVRRAETPGRELSPARAPGTDTPADGIGPRRLPPTFAGFAALVAEPCALLWHCRAVDATDPH